MHSGIGSTGADDSHRLGGDAAECRLDDLLDEADVLHLTGYTFCEPPLLEVALWLLDQARSRDLAVTVDPGSAAFLARMGPAAFLDWTQGAAVCFPNRDEAAILVGEADPDTMAARLARHYGVVVLTLGADGCVLAVRGQPPVRIAAVPQATSPTIFGSSPASFRWRSSSASARRTPTSQDSSEGSERGSTE